MSSQEKTPPLRSEARFDPSDNKKIAVWENEGGSVTLSHAVESHAGPRLGARASRPVPPIAFLNDVGVSEIMIGCRQFECIGALPPHDHPHIFLEMGDRDDVLCPYCATRFIFDDALGPRETRPPNCCFQP